MLGATGHPGPRDAKTQEVGSLLAWKGLASTTSAPVPGGLINPTKPG